MTSMNASKNDHRFRTTMHGMRELLTTLALCVVILGTVAVADARAVTLGENEGVKLSTTTYGEAASWSIFYDISAPYPWHYGTVGMLKDPNALCAPRSDYHYMQPTTAGAETWMDSMTVIWQRRKSATDTGPYPKLPPRPFSQKGSEPLVLTTYPHATFCSWIQYSSEPIRQEVPISLPAASLSIEPAARIVKINTPANIRVAATSSVPAILQTIEFDGIVTCPSTPSMTEPGARSLRSYNSDSQPVPSLIQLPTSGLAPSKVTVCAYLVPSIAALGDIEGAHPVAVARTLYDLRRNLPVPRCTLPSLRGKTVAAAKRLIKRAGCKVRAVKTAKTNPRNIRAGRVTYISPGGVGSASLRKGTRVTIFVAPKPKPRVYVMRNPRESSGARLVYKPTSMGWGNTAMLDGIKYRNYGAARAIAIGTCAWKDYSLPSDSGVGMRSKRITITLSGRKRVNGKLAYTKLTTKGTGGNCATLPDYLS